MTVLKLKRAWCYFVHRRRLRGTVGFGWYGRYCPKCGYTFFTDWTDETKELIGEWHPPS